MEVLQVAYHPAMMENQSVEFRAVIKFLTKEETNATKEIHQRMSEVYNGSRPG